MGDFEVVVGAGTLCSTSADAVRFPHRWTDEGVTVDAAFTGAHLLHLAAAGCVLNDVYREALGLNVAVNGVRVTASGGFDTDTWQSTGIGYSVEIDSDSSAEDVDAMLAVVDSMAEIPKSIRAGATVVRVRAQRASALPHHTARAGGGQPAVRPVVTLSRSVGDSLIRAQVRTSAMSASIRPAYGAHGLPDPSAIYLNVC
jgi:hypothetical protein